MQQLLLLAGTRLLLLCVPSSPPFSALLSFFCSAFAVIWHHVSPSPFLLLPVLLLCFCSAVALPFPFVFSSVAVLLLGGDVLDLVRRLECFSMSSSARIPGNTSGGSGVGINALLLFLHCRRQLYA